MPALPDSKGLLTGISEETSQDFDKDETSQDLESQSTTESTSQVTILLLMVDHIVDDMLVSSLLTPRRHHCYWEHLDLYSLFCFLVKIDFIDLTFRCILTLVIFS